MRTLIVYDGDNLAISAKNMYPRHSDKFEKRRLNRRLIQQLQISTSDMVPSVYFRSPGPKVVPVGSGSSFFVDEKSGMQFRYYEIIDNHGYTDQQVMDYIDSRRHEFERLILVTSDNDFFAFAAAHAAKGTVVDVYSLRRATSEPSVTLLSGARHHWLDELVALSSLKN